MYDGSLVAHGPWQALVTFQQFIILADKEGVVDMTPTAIAGRTSIPIEIIQRGIEALEQPDPDSRTPDEDGRRIMRLSDTRTWGWRVVNHGHYRKIRSAEERREYQREYGRKRRKKVVKGDERLTEVDNVDSQQASTKSTNSSKQYAVSSKHVKTTTSDSGESALNGGEPEKPRSWVAEGQTWWTANVGTIPIPRFGAALKEPVGAHGWPKVFEALKCYVEETKAKGKPAKLNWFTEEIVRWLDWSQMPATDAFGDLTPRGRAIAGMP